MTMAENQSSFFDSFDMVRIINLAHRTDRRTEMDAELRRVGLDRHRDIAYFDAIAPDDAGRFESRGAHGCYLSHLSILEEASANNASVLILEDDADFVIDGRPASLPSDWCIFYGGYRARDPDDLVNSDIIGTHCMGFDADAARKLVPFLRETMAGQDQPPIDGAYIWFRRRYPAIRTVFADPPIAEQRPSRTDIAALRWFDRTPVVRGLIGKLRQVKRRLNRRGESIRKRAQQ